MNIYEVACLGVIPLMAILYTYMYKRMVIIRKQEEEKIYIPDMKRSMIELAVFATFYFGSAILALAESLNVELILVGGMVAFLASLFIFNKFFFKILGKWLVVFDTVIMMNYYFMLHTMQ